MKKIFESIDKNSTCFLCADGFTMLFTMLWGGELTHFIFKAAGTIIIGIFGGLAGLAGKDLYPILKKKLKKKFTKSKNKQTP
jgi:hypothetical protein